MKASLVSIGDELLIGQVINTNASWLGSACTRLGLNVKRVLSISDDEDDITEALIDCSKDSDIIIITGGLGPTKDDITKKTIANLVGDKLEFHQATYDNIKKLFDKLEKQMTESHRIQSYMPVKARILDNKMGTAPGMCFDYNGCLLVSLPGVPYEMKWIFNNQLRQLLHEKFDLTFYYSRTILTAGEGESRIELAITDIVDDFPPKLKIAYLPSLGRVRLRLTMIGETKEEAVAVVEKYCEKLEERLGILVYGHDEEKLEEVVGGLLKDQGKTLCLAESCTGGSISKLITKVPGSSEYYKGGWVSYSNQMKMEQLDVESDILEEHGAVSEQVVKAMLSGAINRTGADVGIAVSGIAGPGGGSELKPVGTIWLAWGSQNDMRTKKIVLSKDRLKNIEYASGFALNMLRKFLLGQ